MKRIMTIIGFFVLAVSVNKTRANTAHDSICAGTAYTWNGQNYTQSGTYILNSDTLILTVHSLPATSFIYVGNPCLNNDTVSFFYTDSTSVFSVAFNDTGSFNIGSYPTDSVPAFLVPNPFRYAHPPAGKYTVTTTSQAGCIYRDSVIVSACAISNLYDTICQGDSVFFNNQWQHNAGAYQQPFQNTNGIVDSLSILNLTVNLPPQLYIWGDSLGICFNPTNFFYNNDSIQVSAYSSVFANGWSWTLNGNVVSTNSTLTPITSGTYVVIATNACGNDTATYILHPCLSDSVYPGDANHDGIVDNNDLLPIGVANGLSGQARATTSIVWQGFSCNDWGLQLLDGTNVKHADCNGDGHINNDDTLAVAQNFTLTHNKTNDTRSPSRAGVPELNVVFLNDTLSAGDTLVASIQLGSADLPVENIYGLAFTYNFDQSVIAASSVDFEYNASWLADDNNTVSLSKTLEENGQIKTAISRTDHANRSGFGEIARFKAVVSNVNGNGFYTASGYITGSRAIDKDQHIVALNEGIDSVKIAEATSGISTINTEISFSLSPNPASQKIDIKGTENIEGIVIYNVLGEKIYTNASVNSTTKSIDISALSNGIYIAQIGTAKGVGEKRFVVAK